MNRRPLQSSILISYIAALMIIIFPSFAFGSGGGTHGEGQCSDCHSIEVPETKEILKDLVKEVSCQKTYNWTEAEININTAGGSTNEQSEHSKQYKVVVYDCGVKYNILRLLSENNCNLTVFPATG